MTTTSVSISAREARWLAIEAQGLGRPRPRGRVDRRHLRRVIEAVGAIQLDAVNVLERTQFVVPFSRLGPYETRRLQGLTGPGGELFEYDAHAASWQPVELHPLLRWRMERHGQLGGKWGEYQRAYERANRAYIAAVLEEVQARGALAASQLSDPRRRQGEWWGRRSAGRQALEWLFGKGLLAAWRTPSFERVYDLPERVIPASVLAAPTPPVDDAQRELVATAAASLGVATVADLADYYRLKRTDARARAEELVTSGQLVRASVEGWRDPAYVPSAATPRRPTRGHATLLSPFDSLIWERNRTARLFGFDYRIEIYVPEPQRRYGYYVLPLLLGDSLVARFDLKADRRASVLRVQSAFVEADAETAAVAAAAAAELHDMRAWLGLDEVAVARRGNLAAPLTAALRAR